MSASAELPFVAAPPGTLESLTRSAELAARHWGFAEPHLLRLGMNGIFAAGDGVLLRVSRPTAPATQAIWLASVLTRLGLRVPTYLRDEPVLHEDHAVFAIGVVEELFAWLGGSIAAAGWSRPCGGAPGNPCCCCSVTLARAGGGNSALVSSGGWDFPVSLPARRVARLHVPAERASWLPHSFATPRAPPPLHS